MTVVDDEGNGARVLVRLEVSEAIVVEPVFPSILDRFREEIDEAAMKVVVSAAEAAVTVANGTVVLVLPEVVVDVDSPLFDVLGEPLSTPLEKIRMQARTAMP